MTSPVLRRIEGRARDIGVPVRRILPAAGQPIRDQTSVVVSASQGIEIPFRQFTIGNKGRDIHVFYSLWEDRVVVQNLETESLTISNRLRNVREGRRNLGQRVLHVAIVGAKSSEDAQSHLRKIVRDAVVVKRTT